MSDYQDYVVGKTGRVVYVAGPMRKGDTYGHVQYACEVGKALVRAGWTPILPQLSHFWATVSGHLDPGNPDGAQGWLEYDFRVVAACDALIRLPGDSVGADREVAIAHAAGIPVLTLEEALALAASGRYLADLAMVA